MSGGKRFAGDFQRIDAVKPNDKMLIQDSADGNVKFAFPAQITTINGWKTVESVEELPLNPMRKDIAYVVGDDMYFWVGTGGDSLGGVYQKANIFKGGDGETPHIHFAYANSADGYNDFSMTESANRAYMGIYADYAEEGSTDPTRYTWVRIQGAQGTPSYVHVAYAESADGSVGFSLTDSLNKPYLGIYVDSTKGALDDPAVYKWTLIKGSQGLASYVHIAYANSADGVQDFSTTIAEGKSYLGTYASTDPQASTNPSDYAWMLTKGERGEQGEQGEAGEGGAGGGMTVVEVESAVELLLENNTMYIIKEPIAGGLLAILAASAQVAGNNCCIEFRTGSDMALIELAPPIQYALDFSLSLDSYTTYQVSIKNNIATIRTSANYTDYFITVRYPKGKHQVPASSPWITVRINGVELPIGTTEYDFPEETNTVDLIIRKNFPFSVFHFLGLFVGSAMTYIHIPNDFIKKIDRMDMMFSKCSNLEYVNIEDWDVSHVKSMASLFSQCRNLSFDNSVFDRWDVSNVEDMSAMFEGCQKLTSFRAYGWNTSKVKDMSAMFKFSGVEDVDMSTWDMSNVRSVQQMFYGATRLNSVVLAASWINNWAINRNELFRDVTTTGLLGYNPAFDYRAIIAEIPATWTARAWNEPIE